MNIKGFFQKAVKLGNEGLPSGDTFVDFEEDIVEQTDPFVDEHGEEKPRWMLSLASGGNYIVGVKVMRGLKALAASGAEKARITKTGSGLDTTYTVIEQK